MESTLFQTMDGTKTLYYDLTAGEHQITVTTADSGVDGNLFFHDFVRVSYAAYTARSFQPLIRCMKRSWRMSTAF